MNSCDSRNWLRLWRNYSREPQTFISRSIGVTNVLAISGTQWILSSSNCMDGRVVPAERKLFLIWC